MVWTLLLSDQEFRTTITNSSNERDDNHKKEWKWNGRDSKMTNTCNKNGKYLCGSFYQNGQSRGKYSDLEHISTETFKSEKDKRDWKRIAYWRRIGHYKWCNSQIKGILWKERKKKEIIFEGIPWWSSD